MSELVKRLLCLAAAAMTGSLASMVAAETCELKLKRMNDASSEEGLGSQGMWISSQDFWTELGAERPDMDAEFRKAVKKEPAKYQCKQPFRCVARLGDGRYGMVFDSTDIEKKGYNRLYLDRNGNGDLTDDEVIKAGSVSGGWWERSPPTSFPTITMPVKAGGTEFQYSFDVIAHVYSSGEHRQVRVALQAKVLRKGEITLEGRKCPVYLLDQNSNGRFDDLYAVNGDVVSSDGRVWPSEGDILIVNPARQAANLNWYDPTVNDGRTYVSKIVNVDGKFYDLSISPSGDKLSLQPSKTAVGHVVNANVAFKAMVYGDGGVLRISGTKGSRIALPEGQWRLLSYTIDLTSTSQPATKPGEKPQRKGGVFSRLFSSAVGADDSGFGMLKPTMVSAGGTKDYKPVTVKKGETVELPFGPPYRPRVSVEEWFRSKDHRELSLALIGSAGEVCTDLRVKGDRPEAPTFAIVAPDGEIVERGKFEFG